MKFKFKACGLRLEPAWMMIACVAVMILGGVLYAAAQEHAKVPDASTPPSVTPASSRPPTSSRPKLVHDGSDTRFEGEKRFRANCGRCHMAPHKLPPRMMVTIERHMRVRAMITDEDMRFIVAYMTE